LRKEGEGFQHALPADSRIVVSESLFLSPHISPLGIHDESAVAINRATRWPTYRETYTNKLYKQRKIRQTPIFHHRHSITSW